MHPNYARVVDAARRSHAQGRSTLAIGPEEIGLARLYSYAFRLHTIGAFHGTRLLVEKRPPANALAMTHRRRALELLEDLANHGMMLVPQDFRAVVSTFYRYDKQIYGVLESLHEDAAASRDPEIARAAKRFEMIVAETTGGNGINLTQDVGVPEQASFIVPGLGITIVPLVYGDYHSWNLAHLPADAAHVPVHLHHEGVEIHLGYGPMRGTTVLGRYGAPVDEGYAMAIPPMTAHGYFNRSNMPHHVPFIFGSLHQAGWGVFLDVEPKPVKLEELKSVPLEDRVMNGSIYLERALDEIAAASGSIRRVLIPASATDRKGCGGLELSATRADESGFHYPRTGFRTVSVVRGEGQATVNGITRAVRPHDHFGVPAGMEATVSATGKAPLILLDALIGTTLFPRDDA
jgi:hypothetical protein